MLRIASQRLSGPLTALEYTIPSLLSLNRILPHGVRVLVLTTIVRDRVAPQPRSQRGGRQHRLYVPSSRGQHMMLALFGTTVYVIYRLFKCPTQTSLS